MSNKLQDCRMLSFVAGRRKKDTNKWDDFLIDKRELANKILQAMDRL